LALDAMVADRAPARTRTSVCSNVRAFPARSAALLGIAYSAGSSLVDGHPWPITLGLELLIMAARG